MFEQDFIVEFNGDFTIMGLQFPGNLKRLSTVYIHQNFTQCSIDFMNEAKLVPDALQIVSGAKMKWDADWLNPKWNNLRIILIYNRFPSHKHKHKVVVMERTHLQNSL